jgi:hypothetical protein
MNTNHQHLLTQLRKLHEQMGELLQQLEQAEAVTEPPVKFADRIKQVQEQRNRPNLKPGDEAPAIVWLEMMDDPERSEALKWAKSDSVNMLPIRMVRSIAEAVNVCV